MRILCPWCHAWFSFDTPDGFFPHLIDAHPQSAQARAVVAAASQSRGTAAPQSPRAGSQRPNSPSRGRVG